MNENNIVLTFKNIDKYYKGGKKFIVPDKTLVICDETFWACDLEEIVLPETLLVIGGKAFKACSSLKSIVIPSKIDAIREYTFFRCKLLREVKLPKNLESIYNYAFSECTSLTEIIIPDNVSNIGKNAFSMCNNLKKVVLPKKLRGLGNNVFIDCPLESLTLHSCYGELGNDVLVRISNTMNHYKNPNFELIIKYDNYKELYDFVKIINKDNTLDLFLYDGCNFNVIFDGKQLNSFEYFRLKRLFFKHYITKINLSFTVQDNNIKDDKLAIQEYNPKYKLSDEIKELLEEINTLSSKLPEEVKNSINQKISKLISDYEKGMTKKNKRPSLSLDNEKISLEVETMDPETILLLSLNQMKLDFSSYDRLLKDISSVYKCKEFLKIKVDKKTEELNSLEEIIQTIIYLTNKIDNKKAKYFITKVETTLTNALNKYNKDLDNLFGNNDKLLLLESPLTNQQLKIDLLNISDELTVYAKKVMPYLEILKALNTKEVTTYENDNSIANTIIGMKYVLPFIINEKNKKQLEQEITNFCTEYTTKIESIITNIDNIKEDDYQKLEKEISKKIHPILEKLDLYSNKDQNEKDILTQLQNCINILNSTELIEINKKKLLESWIGEIHNKLINNNQILDNEKQEINQKLLQIINSWLEKIDKMNNDENMNEIMFTIAKDIAEVDFKLNSFIKELSDFNKKKL